MLTKIKFSIALIALFVSYGSVAQSSDIDPFQIEPTYGQGCHARSIDEGRKFITMTLMSKIAYEAKKHCGWNFDSAKTATFDLFSHAQVFACYGEANALKIGQKLQLVASNIGSRCNDEFLITVKKEYAAFLATLP